MPVLLAVAALLAQDLSGRKPEKTEIKILAVRPEKKDVQAGDVFKVSFDLEIPKDWHIYPTYPTSTGTPLMLVSEALEVAGPYEEPKAKTHPKSEGLDAYDYHEGAITLTVPVRLKGDVKPGPLEVKGLLDYQICKTVCLMGKTKFGFTVDVQEARKRRPPPAEVKILSIKPEKPEVKAGETFKVAFELEIPKTWHIYPTTPTTTGTPTKIVSEAVEVAGPYEEPKPKRKPKSDVEEAYEYHEGAITIVAPLRLKPGEKPGSLEVKGVLDYQICDPNTCVPVKTPFSFTVAVLEGQAAAPVRPAESFLVMLGFAFLGGFILNVMPCVLPVLTIKLVGLVRQKDMTAGTRRGSALAYTGGVLLCLNVFALAVVILRSLGKLVGWGFQFQEPAFVIALATIIFVFALSLLGVFHIPSLAAGAASEAGRKHGWIGHFMTGFFVTLVATPCSAPLLGSAMGYAFTLPSWGIFLFFSMVAFGLAFPFLLVGFIPALVRFMPKPGAWLEVLERVMGFMLLATVVWLADTIGSLTGQEGVTGFLAFLTAVALGVWVFGKWGSEVSSGRSRFVSLAAAVVLAVVAGKMFLVTEVAQTKVETGFRTEGLDYAKKIPWQPFSEENVAAVRKQRKPGFIDFTADW